MEKSAVSLEELKKDPTSYYSWLPRDLHHELETIFKHPAFEWIMYENARIHGFFPHSLAILDHYLCSAIVNRKKNLFIAGTSNTAIEIWNLDPWYYKESLEGHTSTIWNLVLNANENLLISGDRHCIIQEWDLTTKKCTRILNEEDEPFASIAIDKEHRRLLLGARETGTIKFFDLNMWKLQQTLEAHERGVWVLIVYKKNNQLLSGSADGSIKIWDLETLQHQRTLNNVNSISYFTIDKKNNHLFAGSSYAVTIWNLNNYQQLHRLMLPTEYLIRYIDAKTKKIYASSIKKVIVYNLEDPQMKKVLDAADADTTLLIHSIYEAIKNKIKLDVSDKSRKNAFELLPATLQAALQQQLQ